MMAVLYTFSSFVSGGVVDPLGTVNFMVGVRFIGMTLCFGLMLEGIWPLQLKRYFALYWLVTVLYCLAFSSTLAFLRVHEGPMDMMVWVVSFGLLVTLLDSGNFVILGLLGDGLAWGDGVYG